MITTSKLNRTLAATLGIGFLLAISGTQVSLAASNNTGHFSLTQRGDRSALSDHKKLTNDAYNAFAAPRYQSDAHITLPSATPEGNRAGWFLDR